MNISIKRILISFLNIICLFSFCKAQQMDLGIINYKVSIESPYNLDLKKELALSIGGFALIGVGAFLNGGQARIDTAEVFNAMADQSKVPSFDQSALHQYNSTFLTASDILLYTAMAMPFISFVDKRVTGHAPQVITMYVEALALSTGVYQLTTGFVERKRPYVYNTDSFINDKDSLVAEVPFNIKLGKSSKNSFFSGHTSTAACATFFGARIFTDFRPHSKLVPWVWGAAVTVPGFVAFSRYKAGKHFPTDVMTGYAVGAFIGYMIPTIHKIDKEDRVSIAPFYNGKGFDFAYTF